MINIIQKRATGKAKEMLKTISKINNGVIITQDKRAFMVKAHNYGYDNVPIYDYDDLEKDRIPTDAQIFIHNGDKMLSWLIDRYYNYQVIGLTATVEEENGK